MVCGGVTFTVNVAVESSGGDCRMALEAVSEVSGRISHMIALLLVVD
jgi:hypothetical protein